MRRNRRDFLKLVATASAAGVGIGASKKAEAASFEDYSADQAVGCLVDATRCIGCRKCEEACNRSNHLPQPEKPFSDRSVMNKPRRPDHQAFTVVNKYAGSPSVVQQDKDDTFVKVQCMHCLDPACVSACIVGALIKRKDGPVLYDAYKCIGCRYCMVACPFQIPAYEYSDPLTPRVRKCTYCVDRSKNTEANPACAGACPMEAITFGKRSNLIKVAHQRIAENPGRYDDHVYGEKEVGGTSWMYLTGRKPTEIGMLNLPEKAAPRLTEDIQHGIFKYGAPPLIFYGSLAGIWWYTKRRREAQELANADSHSGEKGGAK